jgi:hypothetical protein
MGALPGDFSLLQLLQDPGRDGLANIKPRSLGGSLAAGVFSLGLHVYFWIGFDVDRAGCPRMKTCPAGEALGEARAIKIDEVGADAAQRVTASSIFIALAGGEKPLKKEVGAHGHWSLRK